MKKKCSKEDIRRYFIKSPNCLELAFASWRFYLGAKDLFGPLQEWPCYFGWSRVLGTCFYRVGAECKSGLYLLMLLAVWAWVDTNSKLKRIFPVLSLKNYLLQCRKWLRVTMDSVLSSAFSLVGRILHASPHVFSLNANKHLPPQKFSRWNSWKTAF